ncbi:MAG TPA: PAS domain S-box protein [Terriglobia bacterium]|nr:PAS domain S-box protein [Terriglobia bacterium]
MLLNRYPVEEKERVEVSAPVHEQRRLQIAEATAGLFENSRLPMWIYNLRSLSFLSVNDAAVECYSYSREEFLAMTVQQLHLPAERSALLDAALSSPFSPKQERTWRYVKKDGTVIYVEVAKSAVDFAGESACLVIANDVSEGKRSELLYRMLMDTIPSSVLLLDQDLRVVLANRNFLEKSRRTNGATIGKRLAEVFPEVILAEMGLEQQIQNVFASSHATQGQRLTYRAPGVPIRVYYYSVAPVNWVGQVDHVLLLMDDVTEQMRLGEEIRRMERHLASVVESASDIVISTDTEGNILTWNKAAQRTTGYSLEELKGRAFFDYFEQADTANVQRLLSKGASGESSGRIESNLKTKDGQRRPVSWVFSQMTDDAARTVGFVVVGRDLTEQRKFELQILESQKLAALGVMARGIAHEIRTPLAISSSAAQFLTEDNLTPDFRRECAEKVHGGIRKAGTIIENLLHFAHPSADKSKTPLDLLRVMKEAMTLIDHQAKVQNIEIRTHFPLEPCQVLGVPGLLEQVFINLLLNAMNAMPNGGTVDVFAEQAACEVLLRVTDIGEGISQEDLGKIFDPFFTRAPLGKGTGLGLSICHSIVDQHGGSISVESQSGKGSTFTVKLPSLFPKEEKKR